MRKTLPLLFLVSLLSMSAFAQRRRPVVVRKPSVPGTARFREIGSTAVVIDETLSVLRDKPSLFADAVQRMRRGRSVKILAVAEADGVKFYKVTAPPSNFGWVQSDAVFGEFRPGDEERLARLVQASRTPCGWSYQQISTES